MSKQFYADDFYVSKDERYFTGEYLEHNEWIKEKYKPEKVENPYITMQGVSVRCNYNQIFYPDSNLLLCNNIREVDENLFDNIENGDFCRFEDKDGNEITEEAYEEQYNDGAQQIEEEIYQYYLIDEGTAQRLMKSTDEIIFYSDTLDLYVLGVTHFGTSWDYVDTDFIY